MAKNDIFLIDGIIDTRLMAAFPSSDRGEVFELFSVEQILKDFALTTEELLGCSVDGENDGGIDFIFTFLNGSLVQSVYEISIPKRNAVLEIFFITCKHADSFKMSTLDALIPSLNELLDFSRSSFIGKYNQKVLQKRDIICEIYKKVAAVLSEIRINIVYACRGDESNELADAVIARGEQVKEIIEKSFSGSRVNIDFIGRGKLLSLYRDQPKFDLNLKMSKTFSSDNSYVGLARLDDYYQFITDSNGKLRYYLFDSNVRDYMGLNRVNVDIIDTLKNKSHIDFWLLNNGITILVDGVVAIGDTINLTNVQIINGLQTSFAIYNYLSMENKLEDERKVLVRIIENKDNEIRDNIIRATNNQTSIEVSSLHATDKIQRDIENIMQQKGLYYDRKKKYYSNVGISQEDLFAPIELAKMYAALVLKLPQRAVSLKSRFMDIPCEYEAVFDSNVDLNIWPQLALLSRSVIKYLHSIRSSFDKQAKFYSYVKHITVFLAIALYFKKYSFTIKDILSIKIENMETYFEEAWTFLSHRLTIDNIGSLAGKTFVITLCEEFGNLHKICDLSAIVQAKNVLLFDKLYVLDDDFINKVRELIPNNTKKPNSELKWKISKELTCDPQKVVQAFSKIFNLAE